MPWRLIVFIAVFAVFLAFITFNLGDNNKCDISFGFVKIEQVPVFLTVFISFAFGLLCMLPFVFRAGIKRAEKPENGKRTDGKIRSSIQERRSIFLKKHGYSPSDGGSDAAK